MSTKIDLFLEELRIGNTMEHPYSKKEKLKFRAQNASKMAVDLSRIALDLANAVQNLDRDGNTINIPETVRARKIEKLQNSLELAIGRIGSKLNKNDIFDTKKSKSAVEEIKRKGELAFSEEEWENAYRKKMELAGNPIPASKKLNDKTLEEFRKKVVSDLNDELSRKNNILPDRNKNLELGKESAKGNLSKAEERYEELFIGGSVPRNSSNNISIERFKDLLLDKDAKYIKPGTNDAKEFARDCVRFSRYIKQINNVPSGSPKSVEELEHALNNSMSSKKHGDDYNINNSLNTLKNLYQKRNDLIDNFSDIINGEYTATSFRKLNPSNQKKVIDIVKQVEDLEKKISIFEKENAKDLKIKARVAEKNRYNTLRGNRDTSKEKLIQSLSNNEKVEKFHSGISSMAINKLSNFNKGDDKILDLKTNPINGCTNVKELVNKWRVMGVKPAGQIEIVSQSIAGSGQFVFNIDGKYYKAPRNHFIRAGEGIARDDSPNKGYTKNFAYNGRSRDIAIKQGKITAQEATKYDAFLEKFKNASIMTEDVKEFQDSLHNLKMHGISGTASKKGIVIDYKGAKFLIPNDCSKFPKELSPFKNDIIVAFKNKTHGSVVKPNIFKNTTPEEPYKVGHRARYLLKK